MLRRATNANRIMFKNTLIPDSQNHDPHKLLIGMLPEKNEYLTYSGDAPLITVAPTRTGKSQCQVIPNLLNWGSHASAIVLDVKDELYHYTAGYRHRMGSTIHKFDMLMDGGACFNPFDFIRDDPAKLWDDAGYFAELMIVTPPDLKDPFWTDYARIVLQAILAEMVLSGEDRTIRYILNILADKAILKDAVEKLAQSNIDAAKITAKFLLSAIEAEDGGKGSMMMHSVIQQAFASLNRLNTPLITNAMQRTDWQPKDLRKNGTTIYITLPAGNASQYLPMIRLVLGVHIREFLEEKPQTNDSPILMLLDEFPQLGEMTAIEKALELGGYGLKIWMYCQSLDQLNTHYGKHTRITAQCAVHTYMNPTGEEGDNLAKIVSNSFGTAKNIKGDKDPVMEITDITGAQHRDTIFMLARGYQTTCLKKAPAYLDEDLTKKMNIPPPDQASLHVPWDN